jgi:hypothetical protein
MLVISTEPSLRDANAKTTQSMGFYPVIDTSVWPLRVGKTLTVHRRFAASRRVGLNIFVLVPLRGSKLQLCGGASRAV